MNKKISTLMTAALLMVGALFSNVQAAVTLTADEVANKAKIVNGGKYYLGDGSSKYVAADLKTSSGTVTKKVLTPKEATSVDEATLFEVVVTNPGTPVIQFKATVGDFTGYLSLDATGALFTSPDDDAIDGAISAFEFVEEYATSGVAVKLLKVESKGLKGDGSVGDGTDKVLFYQPGKIVKKAAELYTLNAGRSTVSFSVKDITSSLFGKSLKAFEVAANTVEDENNVAAPAGTYFATNYPVELASANAISSLDQFQACDFIAVDPNTSLGTAADLEAGKYLSFKEVAGADLVFGDTKGTEVSVQNAAFEVSTNMAQENEGVYKFSISATFNFLAKAADKKHTTAAGVITSDKLNGAQTLTITKGAKASYIFLLSSGPIAKPINLLSKTGASVYNVLFLSGKAETEKGKYLGVGITSTDYEFLAQGTAVANLATPQYQFVISAVDTETNEITFTNRETKEAFTCVLDTTTTAGVYNVVSAKKAGAAADPTAAQAANLGTNGAYTFANFSMVGKTIQLIPATVDMYAGFSVRGINVDQTYITFAKDENNADRLYVKAKYDASAPSVTQDVATDKETEAALFELVRSEKPVYVRSNYVYNLNDAVSTKTGGDSIAYYTYYIKYVNPNITDKPFYVKKADLTLEATATPDATHAFILKENKDGSVSIIAAPTAPAFVASSMKSVSYDAASTNQAIISAGAPYKNTAATDLKLFLVKEELGATLNAVPAHVTMEATTGGFISLSENNEGIVAVRTAASEDLTFWLDTADSKTVLPYFYISKGNKVTKAADTDRMFMYYAADSATYYEKPNAKNPYKWSNDQAKIIFKAATLANADTLVTTANGKTVNVAVAADVNGTQGGLNNFRFQIFKADDAEDAYVVRNANGNYLVSLANQLMLGEKKDALKLYVEKAEAPVANEGINASSISVIAIDGAVIVKGAQGKKVAVSNVLGQTIANTVISSDSETIAAPAGVVVVAVEGEAAVKAIVK